MDWASNDPAHDPGLFFVPEEAGRVSLLEEPERGAGARWPDPPPGCGGFPALGPGYAPGTAAGPGYARGAAGREGFYGGVVSSRRSRPAVDDVDWDPRPMRFNPQAGPFWSRFVPTEAQRPRRGGPGPYQAFPMVTQDEAQVMPRDSFAPGPFAGLPSFVGPDIATGVLFLILVILAAQLVSVKQSLRDLSLLVACRSPAGLGADGPA